MSKELTIAKLAAREAGFVIMRYWQKSISVKTKSNWRDPVTKADLAADNIIQKRIKTAFPTHSILSEETGGNWKDEYAWVIDPLDGTVNFAAGLPTFSTSIGLIKNGRPFLGVIACHALRETYWGEIGKGAWMKKGTKKPTRIHVSKTKKLKEAMFSFSFNYSDVSRNRMLKKAQKLGNTTRAMRIHYSGAYDFMNVASGRIDANICDELGLWDYAGAWPILKEAGGTLYNHKGTPLVFGEKNAVATNSVLSKKLFDYL